jgi:TctA family transporter
MGLTIGDSSNTTANVDDTLNQAKSSKAGVFKSVLGAIGKGAANILLPGLGGTIGGGISSKLLGSVMPGLGSDVTQYLALQKQMQQEQVSFETMSTVLKIRADSSMAAIRNMSVK